MNKLIAAFILLSVLGILAVNSVPVPNSTSQASQAEPIRDRIVEACIHSGTKNRSTERNLKGLCECIADGHRYAWDTEQTTVEEELAPVLELYRLSSERANLDDLFTKHPALEEIDMQIATKCQRTKGRKAI